MNTEKNLREPPANGQEATARLYRANAALERAAAATEMLANRQALHLKSAEVWDERAKAIEDMLGLRRVNDAAKPGRVDYGDREPRRR
jgi:hypothetical protein